MPFLLLICLSLASLPIEWPHPRFLAHPWQSLLATIVVTSGVAIGAWRIARKTRRLAADPSTRDDAITYYGKRRTQHALALLAAFAAALYVCGWGWAVQTVLKQHLTTLPLGVELLIMAPLPLALLLSWAFFYGAERALQAVDQPDAKPFGGRWSYVGFQLRQNLALVSAPVAIMVVTQGLFRQFPVTFEGDLAQVLLGVPFFGAAIVFMPLGLRFLLNLQPLPAGPMRERLEAAGRRLNCRCADILVWNTKGGMVNAMVVGVLPQLRYILLSDRLLTEMEPEEVEAVFGHEAGHVKHRHMGFYLLFLTAGLAVLSGAVALTQVRLGGPFPEAAAWVKHNSSSLELAATVAFVFGAFGFVSRRCERQADVYGCKTVSCGRTACPGHDADTPLAPAAGGVCAEGVRIFCRAMDKVADLNGISRTRPGWLQSWTHSTIARRVAFLERLSGAPAAEPGFQRRLFWLKGGLLLLIALAAAALWLPI